MEDNSFPEEFNFIPDEEESKIPISSDILYQMIIGSGLALNDDIDDSEQTPGEFMPDDFHLMYDQSFCLKIYKQEVTDEVTILFYPTGKASTNKISQEKIKFYRKKRIKEIEKDIEKLVKKEDYREADRLNNILKNLKKLNNNNDLIF